MKSVPLSHRTPSNVLNFHGAKVAHIRTQNEDNGSGGIFRVVKVISSSFSSLVLNMELNQYPSIHTVPIGLSRYRHQNSEQIRHRNDNNTDM